ncbi:hypothetical protein JDV09_03195 [Mycobacterium sp. Y57]|uniref:DUF6011 domain-containing protein n=1 Tax=Mycolicibacterium xanthum TaxID=2796469 RepID=UPI001C8426B2|nr:DUF6011 domain-containing protein [Mycolicibacterium xanthum]MBX7431120.1 hypothetical protein [Mycolicibacterium xanthum]
MPQTRKRPAGNRPSPHRTNGYVQHNPDERHQPLTPAERREKELLAEVKAMGYRISVNCRACGHPLVAAESVARFLGPVCHARAGVTE